MHAPQLAVLLTADPTSVMQALPSEFQLLLHYVLLSEDGYYPHAEADG